jgi:hypothetical protein
VKETIFRDISTEKDTCEHFGVKEGRNEKGHNWREEWRKDKDKKETWWNRYSEETKDGFVNKWG